MSDYGKVAKMSVGTSSTNWGGSSGATSRVGKEQQKNQSK